MARSLCKWRRDDVVRELGHISSLIVDAKFVCQRCARASNDKDYLCHPALLEVVTEAVSNTVLNAKTKKSKKWLKKQKETQKKLVKIEKKLRKITK